MQGYFFSYYVSQSWAHSSPPRGSLLLVSFFFFFPLFLWGKRAAEAGSGRHAGEREGKDNSGGGMPCVLVGTLMRFLIEFRAWRQCGGIHWWMGPNQIIFLWGGMVRQIQNFCDLFYTTVIEKEDGQQLWTGCFTRSMGRWAERNGEYWQIINCWFIS